MCREEAAGCVECRNDADPVTDTHHTEHCVPTHTHTLLIIEKDKHFLVWNIDSVFYVKYIVASEALIQVLLGIGTMLKKMLRYQHPIQRDTM